jgi:hypothetical protein
MKKYFIAAGLGILLALIKIGLTPSFKFISQHTQSSSSSKSIADGFYVSITSQPEAPLTSLDSFKLLATISMTNGSGEFEFQWHLPPGIRIINGEEMPTLTFDADGKATTQIELSAERKDVNYQIYGEAYRYTSKPNPTYIGKTFQFNTNVQLLGPAITPVLKKHRIAQ